MRTARNVLLVAVCLGAALGANADEPNRLPYEELAKSALQRAGVENPDPKTFNFEMFLDSGFLHTRLGIYDLYLPADDSIRTDELEDYRDMALTLLDAQRGWLEWMAPAAKGTREPLADLKRVRNWVKAWKINKLQDEFHMAVILITHDLGVVAETCRRAIVMYCGRVIENASIDHLFSRPLHPYTVGLLESIPRIRDDRLVELPIIPGRVPDLLNLPPGCRFAVRCFMAAERCRTESPVLMTYEDSADLVSCHMPGAQLGDTNV